MMGLALARAGDDGALFIDATIFSRESFMAFHSVMDCFSHVDNLSIEVLTGAVGGGVILYDPP
jgi:hypothetical protein